MKNKALLILIISLFSFFTSHAQRNFSPEFDSRHKNIYAELFGSNIIAGVNFDMRLNKGQNDGIGFRVGVGGLSVSGFDQNTELNLGVVTFPLEVNTVVGKRRSSLIAGAGLLPIYATVSGQGELTNYEYVSGDGFGLAGGFLTLGYRHQPLRNGLMFQFNWNPMILRGSGFNAGWIGLGVGVGFK